MFKILAVLILSMSFAWAQNYDQTSLFVKLHEGSDLPKHKNLLSYTHLFETNYLVKTDNLEVLAADLIGHPAVIRIEKNYLYGKVKFPKAEKAKILFPLNLETPFNDPFTNKIWSFNDASQNGIAINKAYLSPLNRQKSEVIVAVVDTGVDYTHEDLKDVIWVNEDEIAGNGIDDDNNGYIDDIHGIDTIDKDSDPMDEHYHGTHVSGTIGATQNNGIGITGIASTVKIMGVRAVPSDGDETDANVVESYLYAAKNGAKLINCSFGKAVNEGGMIVKETIDYIGKEYGVLVFAAAGNDSSWFSKWDIDVDPKYPASYESENLLVVAATQSRGDLAYFSNVGKKNVDLAAPGEQIYSTVKGGGYEFLSGTSMATPTTVGVAAEVLSHFPTLSPYELKAVLMNSVDKNSKYTKYMVTGGQVNLFNSLKYALENH